MATADPNIDRQIDQQMLATAEEALQHWGLEAAKLRLVSRSENVVFEVEHHEQEHYAMRLHRPGYNTLEELVAECTWSVALNQAGISVPQYLYTLANQPYAQVLLDGTEQSLLVGMIEWLDGVPLVMNFSAIFANWARPWRKRTIKRSLGSRRRGLSADAGMPTG
jgi:hypothetical protein